MINKLLPSLTSRVFKFSTSHHHSTPRAPVYAPKVTEKLIWLNLYNSGELERIPAYIGETLLDALNRFNVQNIQGDCGGGEQLFSMTEKKIDKNTSGPFCSGCRVDIGEPWNSKLKGIHYLEQKQVEASMFPSTSETRLACCIVLERWMDDIVINIPLNESLIEL